MGFLPNDYLDASKSSQYCITVYQESEGIPHIMPSKLRRGLNHPNTASLS